MIAGLANSTKDPLAIRKLTECDEAMAMASGLSLRGASGEWDRDSGGDADA